MGPPRRECPLTGGKRAGAHVTEDDVRIRPGRRGTRPRTKQRPGHRDAQPAFVTAVDRGRYTCSVLGQPVTAMTARELGPGAVVVGDEVALVGDVSGVDGSLARIVRVEPRRTVLRRTADDDDPIERIIVANADQMLIVTALADPPPRIGLVDRCLVAAYAGGLTPILCLTKADLADPQSLRTAYDALDLDVVSTRRDVEPTELTQRLTAHQTVLVGHSGVGKSTLVNRLVPDADRAVGRLSAIGKGRHTSSSAIALALPDRVSWVIDTPGIRSFGLAHVAPGDLLAAFGELADGAEECPRGCEHRGPQDECALDDWVAQGHASPARLASYRRLLAARTAATEASEHAR